MFSHLDVKKIKRSGIGFVWGCGRCRRFCDRRYQENIEKWRDALRGQSSPKWKSSKKVTTLLHSNISNIWCSLEIGDIFRSSDLVHKFYFNLKYVFFLLIAYFLFWKVQKEEWDEDLNFWLRQRIGEKWRFLYLNCKFSSSSLSLSLSLSIYLI